MNFRENDNHGNTQRGLLFEEETYAIVGAALEVYYKLGPGFLEPIYHEALAVEFALRGVPFESEKQMRVTYKGQVLEKTYYVDFLCFDHIIVELKSMVTLTQVEWAKVLNYLKVSGLRLGLLFNFGGRPRLEQKRIIV